MNKNETGTILLIFVGYKSACNSNKQSVEFDENDVCDWVDELGGIFDEKGSVIEIPSFQYHRIIKGNGDLVVRIWEF